VSSTASLCWSQAPALGLDGPSEPRWTPGRPCLGKASPDRFDSGSFFLPCFGRVIWAKAMMLCNSVLASVREVPCFRLTEGDGRTHLTTGSKRDPGEAEGAIMGLSPWGYPATTGPSRYAKGSAA